MIPKKHIIVTGADGMGKTTLIEKLTQNHNLPYIGHEGAAIQSREDAFHRLASTKSQDFGVQDRCCATDDPVYSGAFDRDLFVSVSEYDRILVEWDPVIIFVRTANPRISQEMKAHKSRELLEGVIKLSSKIASLYDLRMNHLRELRLHILVYDWVYDPEASILVEELTVRGVIEPCVG